MGEYPGYEPFCLSNYTLNALCQERMDCVCESCLLLARDMFQAAWYLAVLSPTASKSTRSTIFFVVIFTCTLGCLFTMSNSKLDRGLGTTRVGMLEP